MEVLHDHDERVVVRKGFQQDAQCPGDLSLHAASDRAAEQRGEPVDHQLGLDLAVQQLCQLAVDRRGRVLPGRPDRPMQDLDDRPEGDALAVVQAAPAQDLDRTPDLGRTPGGAGRIYPQVAQELCDQPGLADAGWSHDRDQVAGRLGHDPLERAIQ